MVRKRAPDAPEHPGHVNPPDYLLVGPVIDVWAPDMPVSVDWTDRAVKASSRWRRARRAWLQVQGLDLADERVSDELRQVRSPRRWSGEGAPPTVPSALLSLPMYGDVQPHVRRLLIGD